VASVSAVQIVNPVPAIEIAPWLASMATTFLSDPAEVSADAMARAGSWQPDRAWGAWAAGRWVATLRTTPRLITAPGSGAELATDALTNVTVAATHRRQGLLSRMLDQSLTAAKDRGDAVSALIAAEWPIYGRFGYAPASDAARYTVRTRLPGSRLLGESTGHMRQVDDTEFAMMAPTVFAAARARRAGNIDRPSDWWDRELGRNGFTQTDKRSVLRVVHEGADGVDGYVTWLSSGDWTLTGDLGQISVGDLMATSDEAYLAIWHYLLGIDVIDQIHLHVRPVDEPLHWLLQDGRAMRQTHRTDWLWLRILDLPGALTARHYAVDGSLVLDIVDPDGAGFAAGRYELDGGLDGAQCRPTTKSADLRIHQRALATAYLGEFSLAMQRATGMIDELMPGAIGRFDAMFGTALAPWCATGF
jgi:predicted acetyltransferase